MVNFSAIWKDSGFLEATPPFLVIPYDGIGLAYLNGVRSLNMVDDLKFDRTNLSVTAVNANDISMYLVQYSQKLPVDGARRRVRPWRRHQKRDALR